MISQHNAFTESLRHWIKVNTGIFITHQNQPPIDLAISILSDKLGIKPDEYVTGIINGTLQAQPFIDNITTNESYFFRAEHQMRHCMEQVIPELLRKSADNMVRILSLPCARGEEPVSIAILLREYGLPAHRISITGIDISSRCIKDARQGIYSPLATRRTPDNIKQKWIRQLPSKQILIDSSISASIDYRLGNILNVDSQALGGQFDIIFCENVLIYFDSATALLALNNLKNLLKPEGWLFVDVSEWILPGQVLHQHTFGSFSGFRHLPASKKTNTSQPQSVAIEKFNIDNSLVHSPKQPQRIKIKPQHRPQQTDGVENQLDRQITEAIHFYDNKNFILALEAFEKLLSLTLSEQQRIQVMLKKAQLLADCNEDFEAMEIAESILSLSEQQKDSIDRIDAMVLLAVLLNKRGLHRMASQYFEHIARHHPEHEVLKLHKAKS